MLHMVQACRLLSRESLLLSILIQHPLPLPATICDSFAAKVHPPPFCQPAHCSLATRLPHHTCLHPCTPAHTPHHHPAGFPSSFIAMRPLRWLLGPMLDATRPMDNMALTWQLPAEDEIATCTLTGGRRAELRLRHVSAPNKAADLAAVPVTAVSARCTVAQNVYKAPDAMFPCHDRDAGCLAPPRPG